MLTSQEMDTWKPTWVIKDLQALDVWFQENGIDGNEIALITNNIDVDNESTTSVLGTDIRSQAPLCPAPCEPDLEASSYDPSPCGVRSWVFFEPRT